MSKYLLDSNAFADCIFHRRGVDQRVKQSRRQGHIIGTALPVVAEMLGGIEFSQTRERNLLILNRKLSLFRLWPFTLDVAREYGRLFAELRRIGRPMQVIDMMIAATARTFSDSIVVTTDTDLSAVPGLKVEDWTK